MQFKKNKMKSKNMFIEENVLDVLQKNKTLLKILEESFKDDYEIGCPYYKYMRIFGMRKWFSRLVKYGTLRYYTTEKVS